MIDSAVAIHGRVGVGEKFPPVARGCHATHDADRVGIGSNRTDGRDAYIYPVRGRTYTSYVLRKRDYLGHVRTCGPARIDMDQTAAAASTQQLNDDGGGGEKKKREVCILVHDSRDTVLYNDGSSSVMSSRAVVKVIPRTTHDGLKRVAATATVATTSPDLEMGVIEAADVDDKAAAPPVGEEGRRRPCCFHLMGSLLVLAVVYIPFYWVLTLGGMPAVGKLAFLVASWPLCLMLWFIACVLPNQDHGDANDDHAAATATAPSSKP